MSLAVNGYKFVRGFFDRLGYNIVITGKGKVEGLDYEFIQPTATYAPYKTDSVFKIVYGIIAPYTLVDKYRLWELWTLTQEVKYIGGDILEVGTWRGGSCALIGKSAQVAGIKSKLFFCDTFTGCVKTGDKDTKYVGGEHADATPEHVKHVCDLLDIKDYEILTGVFPDDTGKKLEDCTFRMVHIDVDVYQSAKDVLYWAWERLNTGGIIVFDDYGFKGCEGVTRLVNEERTRRKDAIIIHNLNGHAIMIKIATCEDCKRW